jgi:tRNA-2-methylthio-N6-dimethylallyladenosine synthase
MVPYLDDQIPEDEKSRRLDLLLKTQREISFELGKRYDGQICETLFEAKSDVEGQIQGRTTHNKLVYCYAPESLIGHTVPVKVLKAFPSVLRCELVAGSAAATARDGALSL